MNRNLCEVICAAVLLGTNFQVRAGSELESAYDSGKREFEAGQYLQVDRFITPSNSKNNWMMLSLSGDAAFMRDDPIAYQRYTLAWVAKLDQDWDATKGDSGFWKVLALGTAVMGMAAGYQQAQQGVVNTLGADSIAASAAMMGTLEETTGNKDARKNVKRVMADLKKLAKRDSSSFQIIFPNYQSVAGAGMARVHSSRGVCSGVRFAKGRYLVSHECLTKIGSPNESELGVTIGTTLRPEDFAKVIAADYSMGDVLLTVAPGKSDTSSLAWWPATSINNPAAKYTEYGVTWYAPEFDYLVPVFQSCSTAQYDDCGDIRDNNALMWAKVDGVWLVTGFAGVNYP